MSRFAAVLFLALVVAATVAAPVPRLKRQPAGPWFAGWDKPVDPRKDCRFDRRGERLTITIPGRGHGLAFERDNGRYRLTASSTAPLLLRDADGDFTVQLRVAGEVSPEPETRARTSWTAGLILLNGTTSVQRFLYYPICQGRPMYLRMERRGKSVTTKKSWDGKRWEEDSTLTFPEGLPRMLKLAVVASSERDGTFKARFDEFKLTRLSGSAK
jgi:hypothetical protein